jgi:hypothetical protein
VRTAVLLGGLALLLAAGRPAPAAPLPEYSGYTRPSDVRLDRSKAIQPVPVVGAALAAHKPKAIAGTIYYMVLDLTKGAGDDPWGTGVPEFVKHFHVSPDVPRGKLDTTARYLYLYQVVNDSGLDGWVYRANIRLLVDPRVITSWGALAERTPAGVRGVGFAMEFTEKKGGKDANAVLPIAAPENRQGVSERAYRPLSPHYPAPRLYRFAQLDLFTGQLGAAAAGKQVARQPDRVVLATDDRFLADNRDASVLLPKYRLPEKTDDARRLAPDGAWQTWSWALDARIRGFDDAPVDLPRGEEAALSRQPTWPVVRAYWQTDPLTPGERSTVFGFTSNFPPVYDYGQIAERTLPLAALPAAGGVVPAALTATGGLPTPITPAAAESPAAPPLGSTGSLAGGLSSGGLGGSFPGLGGGGGGFGGTGGGISPFLAGRGLTGSGGGAVGAGTGGGTGSSNSTPNSGTNQNQNQTPTTSVVTNIAVAAAQAQQQGQAQGQQQQQQQKQKQQQQQQQQQRQNQHGHGNVVPAPPAWLLGVLGLPALGFLARRRKAAPAGPAMPL